MNLSVSTKYDQFDIYFHLILMLQGEVGVMMAVSDETTKDMDI